MPRILVADDNTNIQKMVTLALQERGVEVTSVGNGEAAVRRLPDLNPDLILADIFMPVRNGYEVCEWVKKDQKYAHIPVILLVGAFDPLDEKEARRVGADGILKKPFIPPDPLIAMVTSTLGKNPKLAAEIAKSRETAGAQASAPVAQQRPVPAPPAPAAPVNIPAPIEVSPVTSDAADDASLAYGFGAGRRGLEDDGHDEPAAARAPKSELEKQAEEEFDGASTTSDWRRTALSFEVSEEDARRPAFTDEDLEPAPIEAAPENVAEPIVESMPAIEPLPGAGIDFTLETEPAPLSEADLKAPESWQILPDDSVATEDDRHSEWVSEAPDADSTPYPVAASETPATLEHEASSDVVAKSEEPELVHEASEGSEILEVSEVSADASTSSPIQSIAPEPSFAAKASHWMDIMGSASGQPQSDWLSIVNSRQTATSQQDTPVDASAKSVSEASHVNHPIEESAISPASMSTAEKLDLEPSAHEPQAVSTDSAEPVVPSQAVPSESPVAQNEDPSVSQEEEDWFFADDAPQSPSQSGPVFEASSSQPVHEPAALQEPAAFEATVSEPVAVSSSHEETEFVEEEAAAPIASRDSELVEPPAVHVTPEPLLVDEYSPKSSKAGYGHTDQEIAPVYTFLPPVETQPTASSLSFTPEQAREDESELPSFGEPQGATAETHSAASRIEEDGVPSYAPPPPTREQLAHIPFLNPPPGFEKDAEKPATDASEQVVVDAVVQRILQKIEPQLHDLLSQNLKPLIENLVHTEIQKHDQ